MAYRGDGDDDKFSRLLVSEDLSHHHHPLLQLLQLLSLQETRVARSAFQTETGRQNSRTALTALLYQKLRRRGYLCSHIEWFYSEWLSMIGCVYELSVHE